MQKHLVLERHLVGTSLYRKQHRERFAEWHRFTDLTRIRAVFRRGAPSGQKLLCKFGGSKLVKHLSELLGVGAAYKGVEPLLRLLPEHFRLV